MDSLGIGSTPLGVRIHQDLCRHGAHHSWGPGMVWPGLPPAHQGCAETSQFYTRSQDIWHNISITGVHKRQQVAVVATTFLAFYHLVTATIHLESTGYAAGGSGLLQAVIHTQLGSLTLSRTMTLMKTPENYKNFFTSRHPSSQHTRTVNRRQPNLPSHPICISCAASKKV